MDKPPTNKFLIVSLMLGVLLTGSINTLGAKGQTKIQLGPIGHVHTVHYYNHPYVQTLNLYMGVLLCLFVYFIVRMRRQAKTGDELTEDEKNAVKRGLKLDYNPLWFGVPVLFSAISNTFNYIGLNNIKASVVQITMCTMIVWTAIFSIIILKKKYTPSQYLGLALMVIGVSIVGFDTVYYDQEKGESNIFGIIMVLLAMMFIGIFFVAEELLLSKFYANPLQVVGIEGCVGVGGYTVTLVILYFIPCTPNPDKHFCQYGRIEDAAAALKEIASSPLLAFIIIGTILSLGTFNIGRFFAFYEN